MKAGTRIYNGQISICANNIELMDNVYGRFFILLRKVLNKYFDFDDYKRTAKYHASNYSEVIKMKDIGLFDYVNGDNLDFYIHTNNFNKEGLFKDLEKFLNAQTREEKQQFLKTNFIVDVFITQFDTTGFSIQSKKISFTFNEEEGRLYIIDKVLDNSYPSRNSYTSLTRATEMFYANTYTVMGTRGLMELLYDIHLSEPKADALGLKYKFNNNITHSITASFIELYSESDYKHEQEKLLEYLQNTSVDIDFYSIGDALEYIHELSPLLAKEMMTNNIL